MTGAVLFSDSVKHIGEYNTELNKGVMGLNPGFGSLSSPTASLQVIKWPCIKKKKKKKKYIQTKEIIVTSHHLFYSPHTVRINVFSNYIFGTRHNMTYM